MTVPIKPRTFVDGPSFTPLPYGLLTTLASEIRSPDNSHWQFGVNYRTVCAQANTTFDDCFAVTGTGLGTPGEPPLKAATAEVDYRGATAFTVFAEVDCSPVGFWDDAPSVIGDVLTQSEQWQVENALWTGIAGGQLTVFPHLAADAAIVDNFGITLQTAATIVSGGLTVPLDVVEALGRLEYELANCYDGIGVIHAPRSLLAPLAEATLIVETENGYRTVGGNVIVFGAGYTGTSPTGTSESGAAWMYATGAMFIYRSPAQVIPIYPDRSSSRGTNSFDRAENTLRAIAERTYVIGWDCCHLAVNVTTGGVEAGAPASPAGIVI